MAQVLEKNELTVDLLDGKEVSEQEYLDIYMEYPDVCFEYVDGRLRRLEVSINDVIAMGEFLHILFGQYFENNNIYNKTVFSQHNYSTKMGKLKNNYRKTDYMVVERGYDPYDNKVYTAYIVIELVSKGRENEDKKKKKKEYESKGIGYYIIIDETVNKSKFYQLNTKQQYEEIPLIEDDIVELTNYDGLKFRLSDLFTYRNTKELSNDPLYKHSLGYLRNVGKAEGIKIGEKKGREEGIKIGEEKGREEGIKIGEEKDRVEEKCNMGRQMKSAGMHTEMIQKITGLSREEIEKL